MANQITEANVEVRIDAATPADVPVILSFIRELAEYEKLADRCVATEAGLREHLFGPRPAAEVLIARVGSTPVGFALYFGTFSTFLAKPGIYLEDLYVRPEARRRGVGLALFEAVGERCEARGISYVEAQVEEDGAEAFYAALGYEREAEVRVLSKSLVIADRPEKS